MKFEDFYPDFKNSYPELITQVMTYKNSSLRYFYLPQGFKDVGSALVFGYLNIQVAEDLVHLLKALEAESVKFPVAKIVGPLNFTTFFDYRAKLNHFELPTFPGEPRNIEFLPQTLEKSGFECFKKYYSHEFDTRLNFKFHYSIIFMGLWGQFRTFWQYKSGFINSKNYLQYLPEIYQITMSTFSNNFLFMAISYEVFKKHFENQILPYIHYDTSVMMFDRDKKLVGYSLCLTDPYNQKHLLFKTIGVVKGHRRGGFVALQIMRLVYLNARKNFHLCLACLMIEGNKIDQVFKNMSLLSIQYGLFQKKLSRGS